MVQLDVGGDHLRRDPGSFRTVGAGADHVGERLVPRDEKFARTQRPRQPARDVQPVQLEDRPRIGRPPEDRRRVVVIRKDALAIGRQQPAQRERSPPTATSPSASARMGSGKSGLAIESPGEGSQFPSRPTPGASRNAAGSCYPMTAAPQRRTRRGRLGKRSCYTPTAAPEACSVNCFDAGAAPLIVEPRMYVGTADQLLVRQGVNE